MHELYLQSLQWILPFPTTLQVPWLPQTCKCVYQGLGVGEQVAVFDKEEEEEEVYIHQSCHVPVDDPTPEETFASFADGGSIMDSG